MQDYNPTDLLQKWKAGTLTKQEQIVLESWYLSLSKEQGLSSGSEELERFLLTTDQSIPIDSLRITHKTFTQRWVTYGVCASIILGCIFAYFLLTKQLFLNQENTSVHPLTDILPGDNRAMLTLADGSKITLDHTATGEIAKEGRTLVMKIGAGEISYQSDLNVFGNEKLSETFNTISTPNAGQYMVTLSDGTRAWLNAASSIQFPIVFNSKERVINVVGEVFLEVKKIQKNGKNIPFKVKSGSQVIEVLGTSFNINNYSDEENIKTTLLEGSIKLHIDGSKGKSILLKPGEQARLEISNANHSLSTKSQFQVSDVDLSSVVAWKEGYFLFDNISLPELMRQIARWYDMEVEYEGEITEYEFVGEIKRETKLSKVLNILESGGVNFKVKGRKIIVTP